MISFKQLHKIFELIFWSGLSVEDVEKALVRRINEKHNEAVEKRILEGTCQ